MIVSLNLISHPSQKEQVGVRCTLKQGLSLPKDPASSLCTALCVVLFLNLEIFVLTCLLRRRGVGWVVLSLEPFSWARWG